MSCSRRFKVNWSRFKPSCVELYSGFDELVVMDRLEKEANEFKARVVEMEEAIKDAQTEVKKREEEITVMRKEIRTVRYAYMKCGCVFCVYLV